MHFVSDEIYMGPTIISFNKRTSGKYEINVDDLMLDFNIIMSANGYCDTNHIY